jgi:hypothetical protein
VLMDSLSSFLQGGPEDPTCASPKSDPVTESVTYPPAPSWPIIASQSCRLVPCSGSS